MKGVGGLKRLTQNGAAHTPGGAVNSQARRVGFKGRAGKGPTRAKAHVTDNIVAVALLTVRRAPAPAEAVAAVRLRGLRSRTRLARTLQPAAVGAGLRARPAAREREPNDRSVHHAELLAERPRVVR